MNMESRETDHQLKRIILRSQQLHDNLVSLLEGRFSQDSDHAEMALGMCVVTIEQAAAVRTLVMTGLVTSAACMLRSQSETITYAAWLTFAAEDNPDAVSRLLERLKEGGEGLERHLPSAKTMIDEIRKQVAGPVEEAMHDDLERMNQVTWHTENSFTYGAINQRILNQEVNDADFAAQLLDNANSLMSITGAILEKLIEESPPYLN